MSKTTVTICSVFFQPVSAKRDYRPFDGSGGYTNTMFSIGACKRGEHKTLTVQNHFQRTYIGDGVYNDIPVYAEDLNGVDGLASDLVKQWATHVIGGEIGGPGIGIIAGEVPTPEEIQVLLDRQTPWCEFRCDQAEVDWLAGRKNNIDSNQRGCAVWLGKQDDYEWVSARGTTRNKPCPMCTKPILAQAVTCEHCHNVVDFERYQQYLDKVEKLQHKVSATNLPGPLKPAMQPRA